MCLQCVTNASILIQIGDLIADHAVMVSTNDECPEWPRGHLGLVRMNDPTFVWPYQPIVDPTAGMSDADFYRLLDRCPELTAASQFHDYVENIRGQFVCEPLVGFDFTQACKQSGYKDSDGDLICWFINRVNTKLSEIGYKPGLTEIHPSC